VDSNLFPCCEREEETIIHALWECPSAQDVWGCKESFFKKCHTRRGSFDLRLPPPSGSVKINWDAALNKNRGFIGLGCVALDWMGNFLGAKCTFQQTMVEPKMAKAISAIHAIQLAITEGFLDVVFEGDSLQLIQDINLASPLLNFTGHYVDSIKHMQMVFNSSKFAHCKREANGVAHLLAKEAAIHFVD